MRLLLDTHAFLWFFTSDPLLSSKASGLIADRSNDVLVSPASYRELAIKVSLGKYSLVVPFEDFWTLGMNANGFLALPITVQHAAVVASLPFHHKDPFDRMIVAQALVEQVPVDSSDESWTATA